MFNLFIDFSSSNVNLVCNIIFVGMVILVIASCLMGLKKGLIKSCLGLGVWLILIILVYTLNVTIAKSCYSLNISNIISMLGLPNTISINNVDISLMQKIGGIVEDILKANDISGSKNAVQALAISVISFFTLIIDMLLCLLIAPILKFIIYILIIKPIFKRQIKEHKLRLGGLCVNGIKTLLVSTCFLIPLFGATETFVRNYNDALEDGYTYNKDKSNNYWNIIYPISNGYNSSVLHYFFSLITGQGKINSYYTVGVNDSDTKVNFADLLGDIFSVACSTLSVAEDTSQGALITAVLSDHTLDMITTKLLQNTFLLNEVVPVVAAIGLQAIGENESITLISQEDAEALSQEIEYIDFGKDLSSYVELIKILNENNYISDSINNYFETQSFDYALTRENQDVLNRGLEAFKTIQEEIKDSNKKTLLEVILPPVLSSVIKNANETADESTKKLLNIFPTDPDEYRQYDVIEFVESLFDVIFNFADLYKFAAGQETEVTIATLSSIDTSIIFDAFFDESVVSNTSINTMDLFNGRQDENGNSIDNGLFDIPFVLERIPSLLDYALSMIDESVLPASTIEEIKTNISSLDNTKENWDHEFTILFNFISKLYNKEDLPILIKGSDGSIVSQEGFQVDLANEKQKTIIKNAINCIEDSKIVPCIIKPIIKTGLNIDWDSIGINPDHFNFDKFTANNNLSTELIDLIDAFSLITPLFELKEDENILSSGVLDSASLNDALQLLIDCEIVNPDKTLVPDKTQNVLREVLLKQLNNESLTQIGFSLSEETYDSIDNLSLEAERLCNVLKVFENNEELANALESGNITLSDLDGEAISSLVSAVAESDLLRPSLANILDVNVKPVLTEIGLEADYFDFDAIDNNSSSREEVVSKYISEGEHLGNLIDDVKLLIPEGETTIDINKILKDENNKTTLNSMLKELTSLEFLSTEYKFDNDDYAYDRIGLILIDLIKPSLSEYITDDDLPTYRKDFSFALNDDNYTKLDGTSINGEKGLANSTSRSSKWESEIDKITDIIFQISALQDENGNMNIDLGDEEKFNAIKTLIIGQEEDTTKGIEAHYGFNDIICMRNILTKIIDVALDKAFTESDSYLSEFNLKDSIIYTDFFANELNYDNSSFSEYVDENVSSTDQVNLTKREIERNVRKVEFSKIFEILEITLDNADLFNQSQQDFSIDEIRPFFETLLIDLHDSLITHNPKLKLESSNEDKLTAFESMILTIMEKSNLDDVVCADDNIDAKTYMKQRINNISQSEYGTKIGVLQSEGIYRSWIDEIDSLNTLIQSNGIDDLINNDTNSTDSLSLDSINKTQLEEILNGMNSSYILHDGVQYIAKKFMEQISIDEVEKEDILVNYTIDEDKTYFADKISIWSNEIKLFVDLKEHTDNADLNAYLEGTTPSISEIKEIFSPVLTDLYSSSVLHPYTLKDSTDVNKLTFFESMVYTIMRKTNLDNVSNMDETVDGSIYMKQKIYNITKYQIDGEGVELSDGNYLTWIDITLVDGTIQEGEITVLNELITSDTVSSLIESGDYTTKGIYEFDNTELKQVLEGLNKSYLLHEGNARLVKNFFDNVPFNDMSSEEIILNYEIDKDYIYFNEKVSAWNVEIANLINIKKSLNNIDTDVDTIKFADVKNVIASLFTDLHNTKVTHSPTLKLETGNENKYTYFESIVYTVMKRGGLNDITYNSESSSYTDADVYMKYKISTITKGEYLDVSGVKLTNSYLTWEEEIASIDTFMQDSNVASIIDEGIISSGKYTSVSGSVLTSILTKMNASYLLHDNAEYTTRKFYSGVNLNSYRIDVNETSTEINYEIDKELSEFDNKVSIWEKEITILGDLKDAVTYQDADGNDTMVDFSNFDITSNSSIKSETILPLTANSNTLKPLFYDFIYKLIENAGLDGYISNVKDANIDGYNTTYETTDNYALAKLKRDTLKYLGEVKIASRDEVLTNNETLTSWAYEGRKIDNFLKIISDNTSLTMEGNLDDTSIELIEEIFTASYEYLGNIYDYTYEASSDENINALTDMVSDDEYNRAYIISELLLNLFEEKAQPLGINLFTTYKTKYTYLCFNNYELDAIGKIFRMRSKFSSVETMDEFIALLEHSNFREMGPGYGDYASTLRDVNRILLENGINSILATELIDSGYLETALQESTSLMTIIDLYLNSQGKTREDLFDGNLFTIDDNYSIEANTDIWKQRISERTGMSL